MCLTPRKHDFGYMPQGFNEEPSTGKKYGKQPQDRWGDVALTCIPSPLPAALVKTARNSGFDRPTALRKRAQMGQMAHSGHVRSPKEIQCTARVMAHCPALLLAGRWSHSSGWPALACDQPGLKVIFVLHAPKQGRGTSQLVMLGLTGPARPCTSAFANRTSCKCAIMYHVRCRLDLCQLAPHWY